MKLEELKLNNEAPEWLNENGYRTLMNGYLLPEETPRMAYRRLAKAASKHLKDPSIEDKIFNIIWNNWLCPASPVLSNPLAQVL